jgi:two-component sensor histidine kinase
MSGRAIQEGTQRHRRWTPQAEVLIREAYHRIGNHLQLLVSLIGMQAREHPDPSVREELLQVRRRVLAVARLHMELQRAEEEQALDIGDFLGRVGEDLKMSFAADTRSHLKMTFEVDHAQMSSETAVTLALIINELVTNAMKYAVGPSGGEIKVRLKQQLDGAWRLLVSDDGPGLPPNALVESPGHGLDLVRLLVRKLSGNLKVEPMIQGAAISVNFH